MHVLILTSYFAPEGGAAAVRLTRLAKKLHKRGHRITVLTSLPNYPQGRIYEGYRGRLAVTAELEGIRIIQTWLLATPSPRISRKLVSQLTFMLTAALRGMRIPKPDVLLVEGQPFFTGLAGAFLATVKRRPFVLNVSDLWPDHLLSVGALTETHPAYRVARRVMDTVYRRASSIVAMSPRWADVITSHLHGAKKVDVILNGVDLERFHHEIDSAAFKRKHGLDGRLVVSFIGTFATQYDFATLFRALEILTRRRDVQILLIGVGSQENLVRDFIKKHDRFLWVPWVEHSEIPQAWAASDLTCWAMSDHPLYRGTIPAKLYEAMASGVPIVAAMEGVAAEIVEKNGAGTVVPCGDAAGLVRALEDVVDREALRRDYSRAARRYAEAKFDPERVAAAYEQVLLHAAGHSSNVGSQPARRGAAI